MALARHEVQVGVGQVKALGVDEALEQEVEANGVNVSDADQVSDERTADRTATRADDDAVLLGPHHQVLDQQEVACEAHLLQNRQFVIQSFLIYLQLGSAWLVPKHGVLEPALPALDALLAESHELVVCHLGQRHRQLRELIAALGDKPLDVGQSVDPGFRVTDGVEFCDAFGRALHTLDDLRRLMDVEVCDVLHVAPSRVHLRVRRNTVQNLKAAGCIGVSVEGRIRDERGHRQLLRRVNGLRVQGVEQRRVDRHKLRVDVRVAEVRLKLPDQVVRVGQVPDAEQVASG